MYKLYMEIKTRFAPSPTGNLHLGSIKAALLPFWFARSKNGKFLLRIDDTDKERSKDEYEKEIFQTLKWMEIDYDYTFKQSERNNIYDKYFEKLKKEGKIYECFETEEDLQEFATKRRIMKKPPLFKKEDRFREAGESYWRFELKDGKHKINDLIFGELVFGREWSDPVIKKPNGDYTYIFASVVDDIEEKITHIIRGSEHLSNAIVQKIIGEGIIDKEWQVNFAHYPIFIEKDGTKMSKRNQSLSVQSLKESGIQKFTLCSFIFRNGSSHPKILSCQMRDYIENFNVSSYSKSPKKFFHEDLIKTNREIIRILPDKYVQENGLDLDFWRVMKENIASIEEFNECFEKITAFIKNTNEIPDKIEREEMKSFYQKTIGQESGPPIIDLINFIKNRKKTSNRNFVLK